MWHRRRTSAAEASAARSPGDERSAGADRIASSDDLSAASSGAGAARARRGPSLNAVLSRAGAQLRPLFGVSPERLQVERDRMRAGAPPGDVLQGGSEAARVQSYDSVPATRWRRRLAAALLLLAASRVLWTATDYFQHSRQGRRHVEAAWFIFVALGLAAVALRRTALARHRAASPSQPLPTQVSLLVLALAGAVSLYWPALWIGSLSDDFVLLGRSTAGIVSLGGWEFYRPVPLLVWKALFPVGGAAALHSLNILLHGLNSWLVARLACRLGHTPVVCAVAGLAFLVFPAAVEPVVWNSGVFDVGLVTLGLFYLLTCPGPRTGLSLTLLAAALLTKETAVVLPIIAALVSRRLAIATRTLILSAALTTTYVLVRVLSGASLPGREPTLLRYTVKEVIVRPFASLGVPWTGHELAVHPLLLGVAAVGILVALLCLYGLRPAPDARVVVGPAIVLAGVLPLWHFMFIGDDLEGSRYLYLPLVGWVLLLADLVEYGDARRVALYCAVTALVLGGAGVWGVRQHLAPWREAARVRDMVIESARESLSGSRCSEIHFENVPEKVGGAFVFRNGLRSALPLPDSTGPPAADPCTLTWGDGRFGRSR